MRAYLLLVFTGYVSITSCGQPVHSSQVSVPEKKSAVLNDSSNLTVATIDSASIIDTAFFNLQQQISGSYESAKSQCLIKRSEWYKKYEWADSLQKDSILSCAKEVMEYLLLNGIIHYWYGTEWDFNGYTATPRNGKIACGYFISTTLLHAGFKLNRYKMAQQTGLSGAHTLKFGHEILYFKNEDVTLTREKMLATLGDGLYFAGLSFHVGYLLIRKGEVFFIHSDYINTAGVKMEKLNYSQAFAQTTGCYVVPVSGNKKLLEKWITNDTIPIITDKDLR